MLSFLALGNPRQHGRHAVIQSSDAAFENAEGVGVLGVVLLAVRCHGNQKHPSLPQIFCHFGIGKSVKASAVVQSVSQLDQSGPWILLNFLEVFCQFLIGQTGALAEQRNGFHHLRSNAVLLDQTPATVGQLVAAILQHVMEYGSREGNIVINSVADQGGTDL